MEDFIPLAKPDIRAEDIDCAANVLKTGMLVQGKYVAELERQFSDFTGAPFASALSNGTATLHLALIALGIGPGDEVIVPAFSYVATANVVELVGAKPVFVDIDLPTFNIDVSQIEAAITTKTKAIIPVHEFGLSCQIDVVVQLAAKYNLFVIEDAACALGATFKNIPIGSFGEFASFSLHPRKAISSGEGGVLLTHNESLDHKIKVLRNHGLEIENNQMDFVEFGYNYRMTDFQAALVVSQFPRLSQSISYKNQMAGLYFKKITTSALRLPFVPEDRNHTWQTFHVLVDENFDRDKVILELRKHNIGVNYGAQCIPALTVYQKKYALDCEEVYPNSLRAFKHGLALPIYDLLTESQLSYISHTLNTIMK